MGDKVLAQNLETLLEDVDAIFALPPEHIAQGPEVSYLDRRVTISPLGETAVIRTAATILGIRDSVLTRDQAVVTLRLAAAMMREDSLESALKIAREPVVLRSFLQHALVCARLAHKLLSSKAGVTPEMLRQVYEHLGGVIMNLTEAGVRVESPNDGEETEG